MRKPAIFALASLAACTAAPEAEEADESTEAWEAQSANDETKSTHLWIVDRAIELLAARSESQAKTIVATMNEPTCRTFWEQGLVDTDYLAPYNDGVYDTEPGNGTLTLLASGATWKSHFYDPDTQKNYRGETSPTARTQASLYMSAAASDWRAKNRNYACYRLGVSLHYLTDVTQPMHAANFSSASRPIKLHANVEGYSMETQNAHILSDATKLQLSSSTPDAVLQTTARASKAQWTPMLAAIRAAYVGGSWSCWFAAQGWLTDTPSCWRGNAGVVATIDTSLKSAQKATAEYLYAASPSFK